MKKKLFLLPLALIFGYVIFSSHNSQPAGSTAIDGPRVLGSGFGCGGFGCHNPAFGGGLTVSIELDSAGVPVSRWIAGQSYTLKITGTGSGGGTYPKFGFQLTSVFLTGMGSASATMAGTFASTGLPASVVNSTNAALGSGSIHYYEHNSPINVTTGTGGAGSTYVISSLPWTAPATGTGRVVFASVINRVNNDGASSGDQFFGAYDTVSELIPPPPAGIHGTTTICIGSTSTLTDSTVGGTWSSSNTAVATINAAGTVTPVAVGTTTISYTTIGGTATTTVTVSSVPNAGVISGTPTICVGSASTLSETVAGGTWSSSNTSVATVTSSGVVTGVTAGAATITYSVSTACATRYATYNIGVSSGAPVSTFSGSTVFCLGVPHGLSASFPGGTWSSSSSSVATVNSSGVVYPVSTGTALISYSVTASCGTGVGVDTINVYETPSPAAITGIPNPFCTGYNLTLSDTTPGGTWSTSDTSIAIISGTGNIRAIRPGTVSVLYSVTNAGGCTGSATRTVTVKQSPSVTVTAAGSTSFCYGSVVLNGASSVGNTYQWYMGTSPIIGATTTSYSASASGDYYLHATNTTGCAGSSAATTVNVLSVPAIMSSGADTFCPGGSVVLSVHPVTGSYTSVYQWKRNLMIIPGATNNSYTATTTGMYQCFQNITSGCAGTTASVPVYEKTPPVPSISFDGTTLTVGRGYSSYQWQLDGVNIPGATGYSLIAMSNGTYTVIVSDYSTGCIQTAAAFAISNLSVQDIQTANWSVFPNPASTQLTISNTSNSGETVYYSLTDIPGRTMVAGTMSSKTETIDIARLPVGNYILKMYTELGAFKNEIIIKQ